MYKFIYEYLKFFSICFYYFLKKEESLICSNHFCILNYQFDSKPYKIFFKKRRGPIPNVDKITDENGTDITTEIKEYMGPFYNFHGIPTCPLDLGYSVLNFHIDDEQITFKDKTRISI